MASTSVNETANDGSNARANVNGYSSLSYLQNLPIDALKIDKSFVQKLELRSVEIEAITQTIAQLASTLSLETVTEGVETEGKCELKK